MATMVLFKLSAYTGEGEYMDAGESGLAPLQPALAQAPTGFAWWLCGLDFVLTPPKEVAIVGGDPSPAAQDDSQKLLNVVFGEYRPNQVVAWKAVGTESAIPLLEGRASIDGKATAYVCQNFACQLPVTEAEELKLKIN